MRAIIEEAAGAVQHTVFRPPIRRLNRTVGSVQELWLNLLAIDGGHGHRERLRLRGGNHHTESMPVPGLGPQCRTHFRRTLAPRSFRVVPWGRMGAAEKLHHSSRRWTRMTSTANIFFGVIGLIACMVVIASPFESVVTLAIVVGCRLPSSAPRRRRDPVKPGSRQPHGRSTRIMMHARGRANAAPRVRRKGGLGMPRCCPEITSVEVEGSLGGRGLKIAGSLPNPAPFERRRPTRQQDFHSVPFGGQVPVLRARQ